MKREFQALFCEKPEVQSLRLTLPIYAILHHSGDLCQSCQFATHKCYGVRHAEFSGPRAKRAVARHLVVLDGLRRSEEASVECGHSLMVFHDLGAFVRDTENGIACLGAGGLAEDAEYLLKPLDLAAGFLLVLDER